MPGLLEGLGTFFGAAMETGAKGMRDIYLEKMKDEALTQRLQNLERLKQEYEEPFRKKTLENQAAGLKIQQTEAEGNTGFRTQSLLNQEKGLTIQQTEAEATAEERKQNALTRTEEAKARAAAQEFYQDTRKAQDAINKATLGNEAKKLTLLEDAGKSLAEKAKNDGVKLFGMSNEEATAYARQQAGSERLITAAAAGIASIMKDPLIDDGKKPAMTDAFISSLSKAMADLYKPKGAAAGGAGEFDLKALLTGIKTDTAKKTITSPAGEEGLIKSQRQTPSPENPDTGYFQRMYEEKTKREMEEEYEANRPKLPTGKSTLGRR